MRRTPAANENVSRSLNKRALNNCFEIWQVKVIHEKIFSFAPVPVFPLG